MSTAGVVWFDGTGRDKGTVGEASLTGGDVEKAASEGSGARLWLCSRLADVQRGAQPMASRRILPQRQWAVAELECEWQWQQQQQQLGRHYPLPTTHVLAARTRHDGNSAAAD
ncbi:hypothetical protein COCMIDRAFT_29460 [Bipolaris oryzae ATCC 44560]|uniref:Uncharacterized protein n=1 Tax=Bipolaris oryzae ATCC 44560 TaxID=930090 RepID=W6ZE88_COCMI|nr:uncharacterized protein COCMIDRAFT_29460 [Bipolaris oryzae ATCC 44560]EUC41841.1 hypothetical protein COCMIDRAFT_29460 [Bipolaris oryzae ATCC 44560]